MKFNEDETKIVIEKEDYELFKNECKKWIGILGLTDWEIGFIHDAIPYRASTSWSTGGKIATIGLDIYWKLSQEKKNIKEYKENLKDFAFHEVLHLLLSHVYDTIEDKYDKNAAEREVHTIIWKLVNGIKKINV